MWKGFRLISIILLYHFYFLLKYCGSQEVMKQSSDLFSGFKNRPLICLILLFPFCILVSPLKIVQILYVQIPSHILLILTLNLCWYSYQRWAVQIKSELGKFWDSRKCFNLKTYFSLKMSMFVNLSMYDLNKTCLHISYSDWLWPLVHTVSSPTISVMSRIFKISFPNAAFFASSSRTVASVHYSWLYLRHRVLPVLLTSSS